MYNYNDRVTLTVMSDDGYKTFAKLIIHWIGKSQRLVRVINIR